MTCERCHQDSLAIAWERQADPEDIYEHLQTVRIGELACTPEQQAGPEASDCLNCNRRAVHPADHTCRACHVDQRQYREGPAKS